jgi:hypothetical protein
MGRENLTTDGRDGTNFHGLEVTLFSVKGLQVLGFCAIFLSTLLRL